MYENGAPPSVQQGRRQMNIAGGSVRREDEVEYESRTVDYVDEKDTREIDYEMMVTALVDFLECDGEVNIIDTEIASSVVDRETESGPVTCGATCARSSRISAE